MFLSEPLSGQEANERIKRLRRYKLPDGIVPPKITLEDFVKQFVTSWAIKHPTIYAHNGEQQTRAGARRSLGDITRVAQYYLGEVSLGQVKNVLIDLLNAKAIDTLCCKEINKRVFFLRPGGPQYKHMEDRDEFGWKLDLEKKAKVLKKSAKKA